MPVYQDCTAGMESVYGYYIRHTAIHQRCKSKGCEVQIPMLQRIFFSRNSYYRKSWARTKYQMYHLFQRRAFKTNFVNSSHFAGLELNIKTLERASCLQELPKSCFLQKLSQFISFKNGRSLKLNQQQLLLWQKKQQQQKFVAAVQTFSSEQMLLLKHSCFRLSKTRRKENSIKNARTNFFMQSLSHSHLITFWSFPFSFSFTFLQLTLFQQWPFFFRS